MRLGSETDLEMDENLSRGYIQLGKARGANDFRFTNGFSHLSPPVDKYNGVYFSLVIAGVGFLLPYNSFIIAVDYFQAQYPGSTIIFDMSLVYIIMAFFAVLANNILVETLPLNTRITFGYFVSFLTLLFVATCEIWWGAFSQSTSYTLNLVAVAAVALGCTVQQSSFYGYTSMLPSRYTQAVMAGESGAGFLVSMNRIVTKMLLEDQRLNTLIFFLISFVFIGGCFCLHQVVRQTDFVQFYLTLCKESKRITLEPTEDASLMEGGAGNEGDTSGRGYGVLKLQASSPQDTHLSFANPVYEPSAQPSQGPTYKVEDVILRTSSQATPCYPPTTRGEKLCAAISRGLRARWTVAKSIWQYMLSISVAYFVTLCLYPGIMSEIVSCKFGSWMPVILMAAFNTSDLMGKVIASVPYEWSKTQLLFCSILRSLLIPLTLLTAAPRGAPAVQGEGYPLLFSMVLGLTNGVAGSIPMIQAPSRVSEENRELSGNIMTLSYNLGLTGGSLMAYALDWLVGPPVSENPCSRSIPPTVETVNMTISATATVVAEMAASAVSTVAATLRSPTTPHPFSNLTLINSTLTLH